MKTQEQQFRNWAERWATFGNLDYALRDPESTASLALAAYKVGWKDSRRNQKRSVGKIEGETKK